MACLLYTSHLTEGRAQEHVKQSHTLARLLLTDVREVVSQLREGDAIDLGSALLLLADRVPGLVIHCLLYTSRCV